MLLRGIVWAIAMFVVYVGLHVALTRWWRPRLYFLHSVQLFAAMLALFIAVIRQLAGLAGFAYVNSALMLVSLWVYYMIFTFNVVRSVSVRTMVELARAPGCSLSSEELEQVYATDRMFDQRIDSMVANRYLSRRNGELVLTARGAAVARFFTVLRRLLNVRTYG